MTGARPIEYAAQAAKGAGRKRHRSRFARHDPEYRGHVGEIAGQMPGKRPVAWSDTGDGHWADGHGFDGHWVAAASAHVEAE